MALISTRFKLAVARVLRRWTEDKIDTAASIDPPHMVRIKYITKAGEQISRDIRPYEQKLHRTSGREMLYATDTLHGAGQIHSFIANRILASKVLDKTYKPKWPLKIGEME